MHNEAEHTQLQPTTMSEYEAVARGVEDEDDDELRAVDDPTLGIRTPLRRTSSTSICFRIFAVGILLSSAIVGIIYKIRKAMDSSVLSSCSVAGHRQHTTKPTITYDPNWRIQHSDNPFDQPVPPGPLYIAPSFGDDTAISTGFIMQPHMNNSTLVFIADGDLFYSTKPFHSALRLTVTVGNVRTPKVFGNHKIAFTATYQNRRELYVLDLMAQHAGAQRITYWDSRYGISAVVMWEDEQTILIAAENDRTGLPDTRLYRVSLADHSYKPVPLTQAIDAAIDTSDCMYFVRYRQSSWTVRYVGGTAEQLWKWCPDDALASRLFPEYNGTMKMPQVASFGSRQLLFFLSDRDVKSEPSTMNVWAMDLSSSEAALTQLTQSSCHFGGMAVQEYTVDVESSLMVLRIGADLYSVDLQGLVKGATTEVFTSVVPTLMPIRVLSDFHEMQERSIKVNIEHHLKGMDAFDTTFDTVAHLLTLRGQLWVTSILDDDSANTGYQGSGQNTPLRRFRVVPGYRTGGITRVLCAKHVPLFGEDNMNKRLALILATDPLSDTAEHAFFLLEVQADHVNVFSDLKNLPKPFLGGHLGGGSVADGGLGSVNEERVVVSSCGRRFAWTDTDDRICTMTIPLFNISAQVHCLPPQNSLGEPLSGTVSELQWSPGGRYLGVRHHALNQFKIITLVDCGPPLDASGNNADIELGKMVQVTPSRFNSYGIFWGKSTFDIYLAKSVDSSKKQRSVTTLYFLSDRDINSDVSSPWGSRSPMPHFKSYEGSLYALPLPLLDAENFTQSVKRYRGRFSGAMEVSSDSETDEGDGLIASSEVDPGQDDSHTRELAISNMRQTLRGRGLSEAEQMTMTRFLVDLEDKNVTVKVDSVFPEDAVLDFDLEYSKVMRAAYRLARIPRGRYIDIIAQADDDGSFIVATYDDKEVGLKVFSASPFPSDQFEESVIDKAAGAGLSTSRKHIMFRSSDGTLVVKANSGATMKTMGGTTAWTKNKSYTSSMALSVWPRLEYRQMFGDAWRMLRDYFYDPNMHGINWVEIFHRYQPLVLRCGKREDLDNVLGQMAGELSALHAFVYGGEYSSPGAPPLLPASLGVTMERAPEWKGYRIVEIPERDPDFDSIDGVAHYAPLSKQTLRLSGQEGLSVGDVIVGVNGESVMQVPDVQMMLRGMSGQSVRLDVLRLSNVKQNSTSAQQDAVIAVPITAAAASSLRYDSWERKSREMAETMAEAAGFTVGYIHMKAMDTAGENAFARGFYPAFDRDGLIIDVRHNNGGNIDSWILNMLQRKAWMFWGGRYVSLFASSFFVSPFCYRTIDLEIWIGLNSLLFEAKWSFWWTNSPRVTGRGSLEEYLN